MEELHGSRAAARSRGKMVVVWEDDGKEEGQRERERSEMTS